MEYKKPNLWQRFLLFWKFRYQYYPRNFIVGVGNLIKWAPVIWKDRDWDHTFFFDILKFKITNMAKVQGSRMPYKGSERNVEIMNTIVRLIDKFQTEHYLDEYFDYVDEKIWFEKIGGSDSFEMKSETTRDNLDEYFMKYPLLKNRATKHSYYRKNPSAASLGISMGVVQHERAKRLIFELLNRNVEKWWE
jgi:hypothetical protein